MMTWDQIRERFLLGTRNNTEASRSWSIYLTSAIREIATIVDIPELFQPFATTPTVANQDWVACDPDVLAIETVVDLSTGRKLDQEPDGYRGRSQYLDITTGKPSVSDPAYWVRRGNRIYLRGTPSDVRSLRFSWYLQPPEVTAAMLSNHPITPAQYDDVLVLLALSGFTLEHPPDLERNGERIPDTGASQRFRGRALERLQSMMKVSTAKEALDKNRVAYQPGYSFNVTGR